MHIKSLLEFLIEVVRITIRFYAHTHLHRHTKVCSYHCHPSHLWFKWPKFDKPCFYVKCSVSISTKFVKYVNHSEWRDQVKSNGQITNITNILAKKRKYIKTTKSCIKLHECMLDILWAVREVQSEAGILNTVFTFELLPCIRINQKQVNSNDPFARLFMVRE